MKADNTTYNPQFKMKSKNKKMQPLKYRKIAEQDEIIKQMTKDNQFPNWKEISAKIPKKMPKQCCERYQHFLAPTIKRISWKTEEDAFLIHCVQMYGNDWAKIAEFFPGRTNNDVKNRFNGHLKNRELDTFLDYMKKK